MKNIQTLNALSLVCLGLLLGLGILWFWAGGFAGLTDVQAIVVLYLAGFSMGIISARLALCGGEKHNDK